MNTKSRLKRIGRNTKTLLGGALSLPIIVTDVALTATVDTLIIAKEGSDFVLREAGVKDYKSLISKSSKSLYNFVMEDDDDTKKAKVTVS